MESLNSCLQKQEEESGWTAYFEDLSEQQGSYSTVSDAASKLRLKKTRTKEISHDDSLEDTATSPLNSPKVSDAMNPPTQQDHRINVSLGKRFEPGLEMDHGHDDRLKKKGLCLVPMSMLLNYFG